METTWTMPERVLGSERSHERADARDTRRNLGQALGDALVQMMSETRLVVGSVALAFTLGLVLGLVLPDGLTELGVFGGMALGVGVVTVGVARTSFRKLQEGDQGPWVGSGEVSGFAQLDADLMMLKRRVAENPALVNTVGEGVLALRGELLDACEDLSRFTHAGLVTGGVRDGMKAAVNESFDRAHATVKEALDALDEQGRLPPGGVRLLSEMQGKLRASTSLDRADEEVRLTRALTDQVRRELA